MSHLTSPDPKQTGMPKGVPYIIGNELAERFSFYGMKGILTVFMTKHLLDAACRPGVALCKPRRWPCPGHDNVYDAQCLAHASFALSKQCKPTHVHL